MSQALDNIKCWQIGQENLQMVKKTLKKQKIGWMVLQEEFPKAFIIELKT